MFSHSYTLWVLFYTGREQIPFRAKPCFWNQPFFDLKIIALQARFWRTKRRTSKLKKILLNIKRKLGCLNANFILHCGGCFKGRKTAEEFVFIVPRREQGREEWTGAKRLGSSHFLRVVGGAGGSVGETSGQRGDCFLLFAQTGSVSVSSYWCEKLT